jgi:signal transduction histidine kinase
MIEDLLDTSRIQAGTLAIRPRATELQSLMEGALERARPLLEKSGHRANIRHVSGDGTVLADPGRIEQVLFNLLDNSSRYSSVGSPILVRTELRNEFAVISVIDHGEGIPVDQLEEIFEPFQRGDTEATSRTRGTGLGLAVSMAIIDAHGGRIWAESRPGLGTTISFTLPIPDPDDDILVGPTSDEIGD